MSGASIRGEIGAGGGDFAELERFAGAMIENLSAAERRSLFRRVGKALRASQQKRIAAQRNPDGSAFAPRKKPKEPVPGAYAVKFLYPSGGSGAPRLVMMSSWTRQGPLLTGFDIHAGAMRSFEYRKIVRFLPVDPAEQNKGAGKMRRPSVRQRAMFRRIRRSGLLNAGASADAAWVGFAGRIAAVARIHQLGLFDKPSRTSPEVRYAMRELLGFTAADKSAIMDAVIDQILDE